MISNRHPLKSAPLKQGLYDPSFEHEACGVGFVVHMMGRKSHGLADNVGSPGRYIVQETSRLIGSMGFNVTTRRYEDLLKSGVVDALKVTRSALENAASVATLAAFDRCGGDGSPGNGQSCGLTVQPSTGDSEFINSDSHGKQRDENRNEK